MTINGFRKDTPDLQEIHDFFIELATRAGSMITRARPLANSVGSKKNSKSFGTLMDGLNIYNEADIPS
jgi:myo-inositol-1(or 4)-monophosphatase